MTEQLLRTRYSPHEGQVEVHTLHAKEKWIEAARRWGKSRCALGELEAAYHESIALCTAEPMDSMSSWMPLGDIG